MLEEVKASQEWSREAEYKLPIVTSYKGSKNLRPDQGPAEIVNDEGLKEKRELKRRSKAYSCSRFESARNLFHQTDKKGSSNKKGHSNP